MNTDGALPRPNPTLFRALVEQGHDVFFRYRLTPRPGFDYLSPSVVELTGYPAEAFVADPDLFRALVHPDDRELPNLGSSGVTEPSTIRWLRKDGAVVWVQQRSVAITGPDGEIVRLSGVDFAAIDAFEGPEALVVIAAAGSPIHSGEYVPPERAATLRDRAAAGPWAELWIDRTDEFGVRLSAAGIHGRISRLQAYQPYGPGGLVGMVLRLARLGRRLHPGRA